MGAPANDLSTKSSSLPWYTEFVPSPDAELTLYAFPYAGGGSAIYREYAPLLAPEVRLRAVHLPGREVRIKDTPYRDLRSLVSFLLEKLQSVLQPPYAFYGHSMGAGIIFELTQEIMRRGLPLPAHIFCSARRAPHIPDRFPPLHELPDEEFLAALKRYDSSPQPLFDNKELQDIFLPILRSDFALGETYKIGKPQRLSMPITTFAGRSDTVVPPEDVARWKDLTEADSCHVVLDEGHFFSRGGVIEIAKRIKQTVSARH